jgi:hypothetical protein
MQNLFKQRRIYNFAKKIYRNLKLKKEKIEIYENSSIHYQKIKLRFNNFKK